MSQGVSPLRYRIAGAAIRLLLLLFLVISGLDILFHDYPQDGHDMNSQLHLLCGDESDRKGKSLSNIELTALPVEIENVAGSLDQDRQSDPIQPPAFQIPAVRKSTGFSPVFSGLSPPLSA